MDTKTMTKDEAFQMAGLHFDLARTQMELAVMYEDRGDKAQGRLLRIKAEQYVIKAEFYQTLFKGGLV